MTIEHRDFDAPDAAEATPEAACTFSLGGRKWTCRAKNDMPWNLLNNIYTVGEDGTVLVEVERFFRGALIPADVDAFIELLNDPSSPMTERKLKPILEFVHEQLTGFPTKGSSGSPRGSKTRKRKSAADSSSPDTTPLASVG